MSPLERQQAALELIAAQLEDARAAQAIKRYMICYNRKLSTATVHHVWRRRDHRISTLLEIADALNCDVEITIRRRAS